MNRIVITIILLICSSVVAKAQSSLPSNKLSPGYMAVMKENIQMLDTATATETFSLLSNNFERIALAEKSDWISYYYAANCRISQAAYMTDKNSTDMLADKAEALLDKADSLSKDNSEIYCLYYLLSYIRIKADPMGRYQQYGPMAAEYIGLAKQLNPANPRTWLCEAQVVLNTPEAFGGGKNVARPLLEKSMEAFELFKPVTDISPNWGAKTARQLWDEVNK
jgi:hypothetical protein